MGTFRKFLFILYSRRPRGRLLVNHEKIGIIDQKILSFSPTVKEKIVFGNDLRFQIQIEDLHLKSCTLRKNSKNKTSGSTPHSRDVPIPGKDHPSISVLIFGGYLKSHTKVNSV